MIGARVLLSADDYGLSEGVSRGILELAAAGRLSATAAMTTSPDWPDLAPALVAASAGLAIGLHLNLTAGSPLGPLPGLAPSGAFPGIRPLLATRARLDGAEIAAEIERQLDRFEKEAGMAPDFVDGHHHVHAVQPVRRVLIGILKKRYPDRPPLVRNPADRPDRILRRSLEFVKALGIAFYARGMKADLDAAGIPANDGFSGFSAFDRASLFEDELDSFLRARGPRQMVMCHPGYADAALAERDGVTLRREDELSALMRRPDMDEWLWRPARGADGRIAWWE